jgi:hypothetical protein
MQLNFTPEHLIAYLYKETNTTESNDIRNAIATDSILERQYEELHFSCTRLPKAKFNAAPAALQNILRYSEATTVTI